MSSTESIYVNTAIYNRTDADIKARYDETETKTFLYKPEDWQISINRFRLPLSAIPLTRNNIPFNTWAISLGFKTGGNWVFEDAYVPQYNQLTTNFNYLADTEEGQAVLTQYYGSNSAPTGATYTIASDNTRSFLCRNDDTIGTYNMFFTCAGSQDVHILNPTTMQPAIDSITVPYPILAFDVNQATGDWFIAMNNEGVFVIQKWTRGSVTWAFNVAYTHASRPIMAVSDLKWCNGYLYLSDPVQNIVYYWGGSGAYTGIIDETPNRPTILGSVSNTLLVARTNTGNFDQLFGLTGGIWMNINANSNFTGGEAYAGLCISNNNAIKYLMGTDNHLYSQPYGSTGLTAVSSAISVQAIASDQQTMQIPFMTGTGNILYHWGAFSTASYYQIGYVRTTGSDLTGKIKSFDFFNDNTCIAVSLDNNLYVSNMPIARNYLMVQGTGNTMQLEAVDATFHSTTVYNNIPCTASVMHNIAELAGNFYVVNGGELDVYNSSFIQTGTLTLTEVAGVIEGLWASNYFTASYLYVLDGAGNIRIYNTSGVQQGIIPAVGANYIFDIAIVTSTIVACLVLNVGIVFYNISTIGAITTQSTISTSITLALSSFNMTNGTLYAVQQTAGTNTVVAYYDPTGIYSSTSSYTNSVSVRYERIEVDSINGAMYGYYVSSGVCYMDFFQLVASTYVEMTFKGTYTVGNSSGINFIHRVNYLYSGMIQWDLITTNIVVKSVSVSRENDGHVYVLGNGDSLLYKGVYAPSISFYRVSAYVSTYAQLCSTYGTAPANPYSVKKYTVPAVAGTSYALASQPRFISEDINNNYVIGFDTNVITYNTSLVEQSTITEAGTWDYTFSDLVPYDSGPYSLWSYQDYLEQVNQAFTDAFTVLQETYGGAYEPSSAPYIAYSSVNKLFTLYAPSNYQGSETYMVLLNTQLQNQFLFPSIRGSALHSGFTPIVCQTLVGGEIVVNQENSTISKFYDLVRILIQTDGLPVSGDIEAGVNNSITLITDVTPDTSTLSPSDVLFYQPMLLRWYNMFGQRPLNRIDLYFSYETKDGTIYTIDLVPGEYASCKLQFVRKKDDKL